MKCIELVRLPESFDIQSTVTNCIAHIIVNKWQSQKLEYSSTWLGTIAPCSRFMYVFQTGLDCIPTPSSIECTNVFRIFRFVFFTILRICRFWLRSLWRHSSQWANFAHFTLAPRICRTVSCNQVAMFVPLLRCFFFFFTLRFRQPNRTFYFVSDWFRVCVWRSVVVFLFVFALCSLFFCL